MHSYFMWEGKFTKSQEKLVVSKTTLDKKDKLIEFVKKSHPYDIPEILIEVVECNDEYAKRVEDCCSKG
jgi:periplasmic divalent cation tolerance protein